MTGDYWASFLVSGSFSILCAIVLISAPCLQCIQVAMDNRLERHHRRLPAAEEEEYQKHASLSYSLEDTDKDERTKEALFDVVIAIETVM